MLHSHRGIVERVSLWNRNVVNDIGPQVIIYLVMLILLIS